MRKKGNRRRVKGKEPAGGARNQLEERIGGGRKESKKGGKKNESGDKKETGEKRKEEQRKLEEEGMKGN